MLRRIEARSFRNLEPLSWELTAGSHLILGDNGAGKTSLLEAVYVLSTTRSFRTAQLSDCCRHDGDGSFELAGEIEGDRRVRLEVSLRQGQRSRSLNGARSTLAQHLEPLPVLRWTASDMEVLVGAPGERRRFIDRAVLGRQPGAVAVLSRCRQALAEKRGLLQQRGSALRPAELEPWNWVLAQAAAELCALRARLVEELQAQLVEVLNSCQLGLPPIALEYRPSPAAALQGSEALFQAFSEAMERERDQGRPLLGPQRDEMRIRWAGHELKRVASAGERKALGLALVAAQSRLQAAAGRPALMLLDDADTELDRHRLAALWPAFEAAEQVLLSSNRPWIWSDVQPACRWFCKAGSLGPQEPRN